MPLKKPNQTYKCGFNLSIYLLLLLSIIRNSILMETQIILWTLLLISSSFPSSSLSSSSSPSNHADSMEFADTISLSVPTILERFSWLHSVSVQILCWTANTSASMSERCLWCHPYFFSSTQHVLFVLLEYFLRWEVNGRTAVV